MNVFANAAAAVSVGIIMPFVQRLAKTGSSPQARPPGANNTARKTELPAVPLL